MTAVNNTLFINSKNVGRIAERIVANELEARGFRVSDLNKDGLSANADLLAVGHGKTRQVQVKGSTNNAKERWWVGYGHCTELTITKQENLFNRRESDRSYYTADFVVLVAVRSPIEYRCIILPVNEAENAAQINIERGYRRPKRNGEKKKPGKVWAYLEAPPKEHLRPSNLQELAKSERAILKKFEGKWEVMF